MQTINLVVAAKLSESLSADQAQAVLAAGIHAQTHKSGLSLVDCAFASLGDAKATANTVSKPHEILVTVDFLTCTGFRRLPWQQWTLN